MSKTNQSATTTKLTLNVNYSKGLTNGLKRREARQTYTSIREKYGRQYANGWRAGITQSQKS